MPPMPPIPPGGPPAGESDFSSTIIASVVIINEATPQESVIAVLTTFVGSIIPFLFMSQYSPTEASKP